MEAVFRSKRLISIMTLEIVCITAYVTMKMSHRCRYIIFSLYVVFLGWVIYAGIKERKKYKKVPEWWLFYKHTKNFLKGAILVCVITIGIYGGALMVDTYKHSSKQNTVTNAEKEVALVKQKGESILANAELLQDLRPENYQRLNEQERANAFYRVMQMEAEYLGIEVPDLQIVHLNPSIVSQYGYKEHVIQVNEAVLCCEERVLIGILHEMYHAYQYACVCSIEEDGELLFFRQVEAWRNEFSVSSPDVNTEEGYLDYYTQELEVVARTYAEERIGEYEKLIVLVNH